MPIDKSHELFLDLLLLDMAYSPKVLTGQDTLIDAVAYGLKGEAPSVSTDEVERVFYAHFTQLSQALEEAFYERLKAPGAPRVIVIRASDYSAFWRQHGHILVPELGILLPYGMMKLFAVRKGKLPFLRAKGAEAPFFIERRGVLDVLAEDAEWVPTPELERWLSLLED